MHERFLEVSDRGGSVSFEQFIRFMVDVTEDQNTAEQVFESFREVADGKPYVTELDLTHSLIPDEVVQQLLDTMPAHKGPDLQEDRDLPKYDYISFMERYLGGKPNGA
jgi:Ca2+-binding EF-hand superfamily protein